jgi:hypothetical protein
VGLKGATKGESKGGTRSGMNSKKLRVWSGEWARRVRAWEVDRAQGKAERGYAEVQAGAARKLNCEHGPPSVSPRLFLCRLVSPRLILSVM